MSLERKTLPNDYTFATELDGLTKREYFAAMAMQGLLHSEGFTQEVNGDIGACAREAVVAADALIAALNEEPPK